MTLRTSRQIAISVSLSSIVLAAVVFYISPWSGESLGGSATQGDTADDSPNLWSEIREQAKTGPSPAASRRAQLRSFQVMRGRSERVPARMRDHIRKTIGTPPGGLHFGHAQYARTEADDIWIVSGSQVTCVAQAGRGAIACDSAAAFADRGLALGAFDAPRRPTGRLRDFLVLGVAPDWADAARLETGGVLRRVPIEGNAYALRSDAPITLERLERSPSRSTSGS
jgi:hypothetical protein